MSLGTTTAGPPIKEQERKDKEAARSPPRIVENNEMLRTYHVHTCASLMLLKW